MKWGFDAHLKRVWAFASLIGFAEKRRRNPRGKAVDTSKVGETETLAAATELIMGKNDEQKPIRGIKSTFVKRRPPAVTANELIERSGLSGISEKKIEAEDAAADSGRKKKPLP